MLVVYMHLFDYNGMLFAYDYSKHILINVDVHTYNCLSRVYDNMDDSLRVDESIVRDDSQVMLFRKMGLFFYSDEHVMEKNSVSVRKTAYISFPTEHRCNLRCKYCFAEHGTNYRGTTQVLTKKLIGDILNFACRDIFKDYDNFRIDFVSGGEPLLNFELVMATVEITETLYKTLGKPFEIFLCTNGTIDNSDIWSYLDKHNINVGISIDGPKETHDLSRVYPNGRGSYTNTIETIRHIKENESLSSHTKGLWALSVISGKTTSLLKIMEHHKGLGFKNIQMKLARLDKEDAFAITESNVKSFTLMYKELTDYLVKSVMKHDYSDLNMIMNENDYLGKLILHTVYQGREKRCYAGDRKLSFDGSGNIYPCDSFVGEDNFILGNIYSGMNEDARRRFIDGTVLRRNKCNKCWARNICAGDCFHNSYLAHGDIYEADDVFCSINKHLVEYALYIYYVIRQNGDLEKIQKMIKMKRGFKD